MKQTSQQVLALELKASLVEADILKFIPCCHMGGAGIGFNIAA